MTIALHQIAEVMGGHLPPEWQGNGKSAAQVTGYLAVLHDRLAMRMTPRDLASTYLIAGAMPDEITQLDRAMIHFERTKGVGRFSTPKTRGNGKKN